MKKEIYDQISLLAEYDFTLGGAQRMLSVIAKKMNKPIYVLSSDKNPKPIWDTYPFPAIPDTPIIFVPVIDKYTFRTFPGKKVIKFCHSGTSLKNFVKNEEAKRTQWLTHRKRVYEFWKSKGFNIDLIPKGYIPYDKTEIEVTPKKEYQGVFISRICHSKCPDLAIKTFESAKIPLYIAGSNEFKDYVSELKRNSNSKYITFIPPDEEMGVSLKVRDELLKKSKILVHCSRGGLYDYLEYSILDGLAFNCVPLCITSDPSQFSIIEEKKFGRVVKNISEAKNALTDLLMNYESYLVNAQEFMRDFLKKQEDLWIRWISTLEKIILKIS